MAPAQSVRPYRDFLMPSLHRRFARACVYTIVLCYAIALWMGGWDSWFWTWFPIGPVGIRSLLLWIPALLVYLLRISQWHIGQRTTAKPLDTFLAYTFTKPTVCTFAVYVFSAWFYSEVYIWTSAARSDLNFTDPGRLHERIRLNERPIFLRYLFFVLALGQATVHLWLDYDHVRIPVRQTNDPRRQLVAMSASLARKAGIMVAITLTVGTAAYFLPFRGGARSLVWGFWYSFMKHVISLGKKARPSGLAPFISLCFNFLTQGALLSLLWQFSNATFDVLMAQEPLKKGNPITSDSKDPNGSLLNGLKSKKVDNMSTAFRELALITERFVDRRKTLYSEIKREPAPTHKQVADACLNELRFVVDRIKRKTDPNYRPSSAGPLTPGAPIDLVQQIAQPLKEGPIAAPLNPLEAKSMHHLTSQLARAHSSPQNVKDSKARLLLTYGQEHANQGATKAASAWEQNKAWFFSSPFGWPFRASLRRTAAIVVLGTPYSRQSLILDAVATLTNLTLNSITEDSHGQWQKHIPDIVRVFTATVTAIEAYMAGVEVQESDVEALAKPEAERKKVQEVDVVLTALKEGLARILGSFNEYFTTMGMSYSEVQEAKEVVAVQQMEQVR